jgi:hypothetical protein
MATAERHGAVGPLLVRTVWSSSSNERTETPRAARCKTDSRQECAKALITKPAGSLKRTRSSAPTFARVPSADSPSGSALRQKRGAVSEFSRVSSIRSTNVHIDPTIVRVPSVDSLSGSAVRRKRGTVSEFSRVSSARTTNLHIDPTIARMPSVDSPKRKRNTSITTEASNMPSMILRTPSMEMVVNFKALEVRTRGLQTSSCRMGDFKALEVPGSITRSRSVNVQL